MQLFGIDVKLHLKYIIEITEMVLVFCQNINRENGKKKQTCFCFSYPFLMTENAFLKKKTLSSYIKIDSSKLGILQPIIILSHCRDENTTLKNVWGFRWENWERC